MVDVMQIKKDENYNTKVKILDQLNKDGVMHKMQANLKAEVIRVLEQQRKQNFGAASKYLKQSVLGTTVTKKVVENVDGLMCAEIIREFMQFYKMEHSLHVFEPEMSLDGPGMFPKDRRTIEREIGMTDQDASKPLLLKLIEQIKFGSVAPVDSIPGRSISPPQTGYSPPEPPRKNNASPLDAFANQNQDKSKQSPEVTTKKTNTRGSKKDKAAKPAAKEKKVNQDNSKVSGGSEMSHLADLPSLGAPKRGGGGFGAMNEFNQDASGGDFNFDDDDFEDSNDLNQGKSSPNKMQDAEKHLRDFDQEENEGFRVQMPVKQNNQGRRHNSFKVQIDGVSGDDSQEDDIEDEVEELIEEELPNTDRDEAKQNLGDGLQNSGGNYGITVSQSLGIDPSVDSLALDEYDHIETVGL